MSQPLPIKCSRCPSSDKPVRSHGKFFRKSDRITVYRYKCTGCGSTFSDATFDVCYRQKKRHLNNSIFILYGSGVSLRRMSCLLTCSYRTVTRKLSFVADLAAKKLERDLKESNKIEHLQFDDVETFEHTKCKPLSITLMVEPSTRRILATGVSQIAAKGKLAQKAKNKYGPRPSTRKQERNKQLQHLKPYMASDALIETDKDPRYKKSVRDIFPEATHRTYKGRKGCVVGQGELKRGGRDPLFSLNHTAAMLRANMNRLFRRTWNTTKKPERLKEHLLIYSCMHNFLLLPKKQRPKGEIMTFLESTA